MNQEIAKVLLRNLVYLNDDQMKENTFLYSYLDRLIAYLAYIIVVLIHKYG